MASRARGQGVNRRPVPPRRTFRYWPEAQGQQSPGVQDGCRLLQPPPPHKPCRAVPGCSGPWPGRALATGVTWWEAGLSCPLPGKVHRATPSTSPQNSPVTPEGDAVSSGPGTSQSGTSPRLPACPVGPLPRVARPSSVSASASQLSSFMRVQSRAGGAWEGTDRLTARRSAPFSAERGVRLPAALPVALPGAISAPRPNGEAGCHVWPLKPGSPWWGAGQPCPGRGTTAWGLAPDRGRLPITLRGPPGRG